jgi:hypothetical protein
MLNRVRQVAEQLETQPEITQAITERWLRSGEEYGHV